MNVVLTLTTIPSRLNSNYHTDIKACLDSLINQNYPDYKIYFNIPTVSRIDGAEYIIPEWLINLNEKIIIHRVVDIGPATKLVPTLSMINDPETIIIVVDDDLIYHPEMINEHIKNQEKWPESVVGYDGLRAKTFHFNDVRDYYFSGHHVDSKVDIVQHYKSVSYKRRYFENDFEQFVFNYFSWSDDLLVSAYFASKKRDRMITYYEPDPIFESIEEWQEKGGVTTFPVLAHTQHDSVEGCNVYRGNGVDDNGSELYKFIDNGY